jgi:ferredoxin
MANSTAKHPLNQNGRFFNDLNCIDCGMCVDIAPQVFRRDEDSGYSYVYQQPRSAEEIKAAETARDSCPTESIGEE